MAYYRSIFTVTVLSDRPLPANMPLHDIDYQIDQGDCVGKVERTAQSEVTPKHMAWLLNDLGSGPDFFNLDATGELLED